MSRAAERAAFLSGVEWGRSRQELFDTGYVVRTAPAIAEARYPKMTITRPREVEINDITYRAVNGVVEMFLMASGEWTPSSDYPKFAALVANPTETVELD